MIAARGILWVVITYACYIYLFVARMSSNASSNKMPVKSYVQSDPYMKFDRFVTC